MHKRDEDKKVVALPGGRTLDLLHRWLPHLKCFIFQKADADDDDDSDDDDYEDVDEEDGSGEEVKLIIWD